MRNHLFQSHKPIKQVKDEAVSSRIVPVPSVIEQAVKAIFDPGRSLEYDSSDDTGSGNTLFASNKKWSVLQPVAPDSSLFGRHIQSSTIWL
jgi:hypothetical protein